VPEHLFVTIYIVKIIGTGVVTSRSRPRESNNNPYSKSLFRTVKYHLRWPSEALKSLEEARKWVKEFVNWYNNEHRHSRIKFVTANQRHDGLGLDIGILAKRKTLYREKRREVSVVNTTHGLTSSIVK
jgi:putative transposase